MPLVNPAEPFVPPPVSFASVIVVVKPVGNTVDNVLFKAPIAIEICFVAPTNASNPANWPVLLSMIICGQLPSPYKVVHPYAKNCQDRNCLLSI